MNTSQVIDRLYKASLPGSRVKLDPEELEVVGDPVLALDSLLFGADVNRLSFDVALVVLQRSHSARNNLAMYKGFFEQCFRKFRKHYRWHEMRVLGVPLGK